MPVIDQLRTILNDFIDIVLFLVVGFLEEASAILLGDIGNFL